MKQVTRIFGYSCVFGLFLLLFTACDSVTPLQQPVNDSEINFVLTSPSSLDQSEDADMVAIRAIPLEDAAVQETSLVLELPEPGTTREATVELPAAEYQIAVVVFNSETKEGYIGGFKEEFTDVEAGEITRVDLSNLLTNWDYEIELVNEPTTGRQLIFNLTELSRTEISTLFLEPEGTLLAKDKPFEVGDSTMSKRFDIPQEGGGGSGKVKIKLPLDNNFGGEIFVRLKFDLKPEWPAAGEGQGPEVIYRPSSGQDALNPIGEEDDDGVVIINWLEVQ